MKGFGAGAHGTDFTEACGRNFLQHGNVDILVGAHSADGKGFESKRVFTFITPNGGENLCEWIYKVENNSQGIGSSN